MKFYIDLDIGYRHREITIINNIIGGIGAKIKINTTGYFKIITIIKHRIKINIAKICLKYLCNFNRLQEGEE